VSAAKSAVLDVSGLAVARARASDPAGEPSPVVPLMILVLGLAVATMWFVALPALEQPPPRRTCEVVFLKGGTTRCIEPPVPGMRAVPPGTKRSAS
jgi:hypothetical protein